MQIYFKNVFILKKTPSCLTRALILCMFSSFRLCETVVPLEDPIITETTSTLQEWGILWKQLYVVSSSSTKGVGTVQEQQTASCFVFICVLLGGEGDVDAKGVFLLPARVANIWRFSPNIARQLL